MENGYLVLDEPEANEELPMSQPSPASLPPSPAFVTPSTALNVTRTIHKIREQHHMALFESVDEHPLQYPSHYDHVRPEIGDIYVHTWGAVSETQIWVRVDNVWKEAQEGFFHPTIRTHCLYRM